MATQAPPADLTTAYERTLELATGQSALAVRRQLRLLETDAFASSWSLIAPQVAQSVRAGQESALIASAWYMAETIRTTTAFAPEIAPMNDLAGTTGSGMSVDRYVARTPDVVAVRTSNGMALEEAIAMSIRAITSLAVTEPFRIARAAVAQTATNNANFVGWRRVAEAGACAFCRTLASRGAAYKTKETASQTSRALSFHKNCRCRAEPVTSMQAAATQAAIDLAYADLQRPIFYRTGTRSARVTNSAPGAARQRVSADFYRRAPLYRPGARTPERLANVQLQIGQIEDRISDLTARSAAGDVSTAPALKWSTARLRELRSELSSLT